MIFSFHPCKKLVINFLNTAFTLQLVKDYSAHLVHAIVNVDVVRAMIQFSSFNQFSYILLSMKGQLRTTNSCLLMSQLRGPYLSLLTFLLNSQLLIKPAVGGVNS